MNKILFTLSALFTAGILSAAEIIVPSINGSETSKETILPAVQFKESERVILNFTAFMQRKKAIGWAPVAALRINGKHLKETDSAGKLRLLNKGDGFKTISKGKEGKESWWYQKSRFRVFYGPGTGKADARVQLGEEAWKYSMDITDLIKSGKPVTVRAINYLYKNLAGFDAAFVVKDLELKVVPEKK